MLILKQRVPHYIDFLLHPSHSIPIEKGLPLDASDEQKLVSMELQSKLKKKLDPYVDRKGQNVLRSSLPPIYDNLLKLKPSPIQEKLISLEKRERKKGNKNRSFLWYVDIAREALLLVGL